MEKLLPQLRFPEFKGEWEKKKLADVAEFKAGYAFKSNDMLSTVSNYQLLKMSNVYQSEFRLDRNPSYWESVDKKQKEFLLKKGDSILTLTGTVGKRDYGYSVLIKESNKFLLNQRLVLLREKKGKSVNEFINYILSNERFLFYFFAEAKGGTGNQTNVSTEDVKNIQLNFPSHPEQTKIAAFLTAVDNKLTALKQKKTLLEQYKKGVMQQIFAQELRFKDDNGIDFADWEEKKLGEMCDVIMGQSPDSRSYNSDRVGIPLIQGNADIKNRKTNPRNYTTQLTKECKIGDLILTVRAPVGAVAKSIHNACIGRGVCSIKNKSNSSIEFIFQFLLDYEVKWGSLEQGSTFTAVSGTEIRNLKIISPCIEEQTKIANFLSAIDEKINHCQGQIDQTTIWKKGLLQQLFV
jgi:type I restriction enzyme S subunit